MEVQRRGAQKADLPHELSGATAVMLPRSFPWACAVVVCAAALSVGLVGRADAAFPGRDGSIVFGRYDEEVEAQDGGAVVLSSASTLARLNPRTGVTRKLLTCPPAECGAAHPMSSHGSRFLIFDGIRGTRVARADGSRVTLVPGGGEFPSWSPDGRRFVSSSRPRRGDSNLIVARLDGSSRRQVTFRGGGQPRWSTGNEIAFTRFHARRHGRFSDVLSVRTDGSRARVLARGGDRPDWSPHGSRVVYETNGGDVAVVNREGRHRRVIVRNGGQPVWSPSGRWIAFSRKYNSQYVSGNESIYIVRARGGKPRRVLSGATSIQGITWESR